MRRGGAGRGGAGRAPRRLGRGRVRRARRQRRGGRAGPARRQARPAARARRGGGLRRSPRRTCAAPAARRRLRARDGACKVTPARRLSSAGGREGSTGRGVEGEEGRTMALGGRGEGGERAGRGACRPRSEGKWTRHQCPASAASATFLARPASPARASTSPPACAAAARAQRAPIACGSNRSGGRRARSTAAAQSAECGSGGSPCVGHTR